MKILNKKTIAKILPKRPNDANKGVFGKVLVVAGSENYPGAAYLSCAAAYRVGAGLVTLVTIPSVKTIVSKKLPEVTFISPDKVFGKVSTYDAVLAGPGLGQDSSIVKFVLLSTVIDADGLNILSKIDKWWEKLSRGAVLTPHPGEMSRLTGLEVNEIQSDRENIAQKFSKKWGNVVVLKGANTVIASPNGQVALSPFANPALATAGTGDILAGMIAGFIAQGFNNFDAACVSVFIHGLAGEMIKKKLGDRGVVASDLLPILPKALLNVTKHRVG